MFLRLGVIAALFSTGALFAAVPRIGNTPHLLQEGFGPYGEYLPNDGREYCVPTSWTMAMYWLRADGYRRAAPPFSRRAALSTDLALAGLYGTTPGGGTEGVAGSETIPKSLLYLRLRGLGAATFRSFTKPRIEDLAQGLVGNRIGVINIAWVDAQTFERTGGHDVTLVGVGVNAQGGFEEGMVAINNPMAPQTQYSPTEILRDARFWSGYLAFTGGVIVKKSTPIAVISGFSYIDPGPSDQRLSSYRSPRNLVLDAVGGSFKVLAPLVGPKGLIKRGDGEVVLTGRSRSTYRGPTKIEGGRLVSAAANGLAVGNGTVDISGGELAVRSARTTVRLGRGTVKFEGGTLALDPRGDGRLRLVLGGTLERGFAGSLILAPRRGLDDLGAGTLFLAGNDDGAILGCDRDGSGDFLEESESSGLVRARVPTASRLAERSQWAAVAASGEQWVGGEVRVRSLRLDGATVTGTGTLRTSGDEPRGVAGIILNHSRIATGSLRLGADETIVYASRAGGRIDSRIEGRGALIVAGPGRLTLGGANRRTALTTVSGATLAVEGVEESAGGAIHVSTDATLTGNGRAGGDVDIDGTVQPGRTGGGLRVGGNATFETESRIVWRLDREGDGRAGAGFGWSFLDVEGSLTFVGGGRNFETLQLDFSDSVRPDPKKPFWKRPHRWLIARGGQWLDISGLAIQNPRFEAGQFSLDQAARELFLVYTPAPAAGG